MDDSPVFTVDFGAKDTTTVLDLGKVVDNSNFVLRAFRIKNLHYDDIIVSLGSDRGEEIHFQLSNENLGDRDIMAADGSEDNFNELFNTVGWIDTISIAAGMEQRIVMVYLPRSRVMRSDGGNDVSPYGLKGALIFKAYKTVDPVQNSTEASSDPFCIAIPFTAQLYQSRLALQGAEIMFSGCTPGGTYYRDFTIKNLSDIPLFFNILLMGDAFHAAADKTLELSDHSVRNMDGDNDTGGGSLRDGMVKSHGQLRIRITFKPRKVGDFVFTAVVENLNNFRNKETVRMTAFVNNEEEEEGLDVSVRIPGKIKKLSTDSSLSRPREQVLDFGSCFTGVGARRILCIKNVTKERMNIVLTSDADQEVRFDLHNDLADSDSDDDEDEDLNRKDVPGAGTKTTAQEEVKSVESLLNEAEESDAVSRDISAKSPPKFERFPSESTSGRPIGGSIDDDGSVPKVRIAPEDIDPRYRRNEELSMHATTNAAGLKKKKNISEDEETRHRRIEELDLMPEQERSVVVWYCPSIKPSNHQGAASSSRPPGSTYDKDLACLQSKSFQVILKTTHLHEKSQRLSRSDSTENVEYTQSHSAKRRKFISARAKVCTAFIEASKEVNLGDCTIGSSSKGQVHVRNMSDLPCTIKIEFSSKILKLSDSSIRSDGTAVIPPLTLNTFQLEISPMRINPGYCKQITIVNVTNRLNDQFVNLRANNVDSNRVSLHALFYHVCSENSSNMISFDTLVTNCPMIRSFTLKNLTAAEITLELLPSVPDAMKIYIESSSSQRDEAEQKKRASVRRPTAERPRRAVESSTADLIRVSSTTGLRGDGRMDGLATVDDIGTKAGLTAWRRSSACTDLRMVDRVPRWSGADAMLAKEVISEDADPRKSRRSVHVHKRGHDDGWSLSERPEKSARNWAEIKAQFERPSYPSATNARYFNTVEEEVNYIKMQIELRSDLERAIKHQELVPVTQVNLAAHAIQSLVLVYTPHNLASGGSKDNRRGRVRPLDSNIDIKMLDYDQSMLDKYLYHRGKPVNYTSEGGHEDKESDFKIPVRCLPVTAKVCESIMEVAQHNLNFGTLYVNQDYRKKLIIKNLSDVPLLYQIVKTQNWVSNVFMNFDGDESLGFIKPHGHHERDFVFTPKISLKFREELRIVNLQNPDNVIKILVKAVVRKRDTFSVNPPAIDLGKVTMQMQSKSKRFELYNLTSSSRTVLMKVADVSFEQATDSSEHTAASATPMHVKLPDGSICIIFTPEKCSIDGERTNREEELEKMERKLKIYERKGKKAKADKMRLAIQALQGAKYSLFPYCLFHDE